MSSLTNGINVRGAKQDGEVFSDTLQYDMLIYTESSGQSVLVGVGVDPSEPSTLAVRDDALHVNADTTFMNANLRLDGNIDMVGGFRIDNGLTVKGDTVLREGTLEVRSLDAGCNVLFDIDESRQANDDAVIVAHRTTRVDSNLEVADRLVVEGDLDLRGRVTTSNFGFGSNVRIDGRLSVGTSFALDGALSSDAASGSTIVRTDLEVGSNLVVRRGDVALEGGRLRVSDAASSTPILTADASNVAIAQELRVSGDARFRSDVRADAEMDVAGPTRLGCNLRVEGDAELRGNFTVVPDPGAADANPALVVRDSNVSLRRDVEAASNLDVIGGDVVLHSGDLRLLNGALTTNDASTSRVRLGKDTTVASNLEVFGRADVRGALEAAGGAVRISDAEAMFRRPLIARCNVQTDSDFDIGSNLVVRGDLDVRGDATLSDLGDLVLEGGELRVKPRSVNACNITALEVTDQHVTASRDLIVDSNVEVRRKITVREDGAEIQSGGILIVSGDLVTAAGSMTAGDAGFTVKRDALFRSNLTVEGGAADVTGGILTVTPDGTNVMLTVGNDFVTCHGMLNVRRGASVSGGDAVFEGGSLVVNPSGSTGGEVLTVEQGGVSIDKDTTVNGVTVINDDFTVAPSSPALRVREDAVSVDRDATFSCNVTSKGDLEVRGGRLFVESVVGNGVVFTVDDTRARADRQLISGRDFLAEQDATVRGTLRVDPLTTGSLAFRVTDTRIDAQLATRIVGELDVRGPTVFQNGAMSVRPASVGGAEVLSVTDVRVRATRDLLLDGADALFVGSAFEIRNAGSTAVDVTAARARFDRDVVARCNLDVLGTLEATGTMTARADLDVGGDLNVDSNLSVRGSARVLGDLDTEGDFLVYRAPPDSAYASSNELVASITPARTTLNTTETHVRGPLSVYASSASSAPRVLHVRPTRVDVNEPLYVTDSCDVRPGPLRVGNQDASDADYLVAEEQAVRVNRRFEAACNVDVTGDLSVAGSNASVAGDLSVGESFTVTGGDTTLGCNLDVGKSAAVGDDLEVGGTAAVLGGLLRVVHESLGDELLRVDGSSVVARRDLVARCNVDIAANLDVRSGRLEVTPSDVRARASNVAAIEAGCNVNVDTAEFELVARPSGHRALYASDSNFEVRRDALLGSNARVGGALTVDGSARVASDEFTVGETDPTRASLVIDGGNRVRVNRDALVASNLEVGGGLDLGADAEVAGTLTVDGRLETRSNLVVRSSTDLYGPLRIEIAGAPALEMLDDGFTVRRDAEAKSNLVVRGQLRAHSNVEIYDELVVRPTGSNELAVMRVSAADVTLQRDLSVDSNLRVERDALVQRDLEVRRNARVSNVLEVGSGLEVSGYTDLEGSLNVSGEIVANPGNGTDVLVVGSNLVRVMRDTEITGNTSISAGELEVTKGGTLSLFVGESETVINRDLVVNGDVRAQQNASVGNDLDVERRLTVGENTTVKSNLDVGNDTTLSSNLEVKGRATLRDEFEVYTASSSTLAFRVGDCNVDAHRDTRVFADMFVEGDLSVHSNLDLRGDLSLRHARLAEGSASDLALAFTRSPDTGFFIAPPGSNSLVFLVNGARSNTFTEEGIETGKASADEFYGDGCNVTGLNADNVTSGVLNVARGGTGVSSFEDDKLLVGNGTSGLRTSPQLHWDAQAGRLGVGVSSGLGAKLHVDGDVLATGFVASSNGTASDLAFAFGPSPDTGFFRNASGEVEMSVGGARETRFVPSGVVAKVVDATTLKGDGSNVTNLDADKMTLGVLAVERGGTGSNFHAASKVLVGNGSNAVQSPSNLHWDDSNGRLGINVVDPNHALHVIGEARATHLLGEGSGVTNLDMDNAGLGVLSVPRGGTGQASHTASKLLVGDGTNAIVSPANLHWDAASQRLGVGTDQPDETLHVVGTCKAIAFTGDGNALTNLDMNSAGTGVLNVDRGGTGRSSHADAKLMVGNGTNGLETPSNLHWDAENQRLGVGTDKPDETLHVVGTCKAIAFTGDGNALTNLDMNSAGTGVLNVDRGGTGAASHAEYKLVVGNNQDPLLTPPQLHWNPATCNLGIDVGTNPQDMLHVRQRVRASAFVGDGNAVTNLDMNKAGTGVLDVDRGGTGTASHGNNKLLVGNGTGAIQSPADLHWTGVNLGINTSNPDELLTVNGHTKTNVLTVLGSATADTLIGDGSQITNLSLNNTGTNATPLSVSNGGTGVKTLTDNKLLVGSGTADVRTPTDLHYENGNLGVGNQNPQSKLHVGGDTRSTTFTGVGSALRDLDANNVTLGILDVVRGGTGVGSHPANRVVIGNGTSGLLSSEIYWDGTHMGVGTSNPDHLLDVDGTTRTTDLIVRNVARAAFYEGDGSRLSNITMQNVSSGVLDVQYGGTGRSTLDDTKVLVGNGNNSIESADKLTYAGGNLGVNVSNPTSRLEVDGNIRATGDIVAESDARIKANLRPIRDAVSRVAMMRGYLYDKKDDGKKHDQARKLKDTPYMGLVAQEVAEIVPEVIHHDEKNDKFGVAYGNLVALLVEAIKEMNDSFGARLAKLEEKI